MIESGLTRKVKTLQRDLGWALLMSREGVLSEETFRRLLERLQDTSAALSGSGTQPPGVGLSVTVGAAGDPPGAIAGWIRYLESFIRPPLITPGSRSGPTAAV
jgi:hypothetical protein